MGNVTARSKSVIRECRLASPEIRCESITRGSKIPPYPPGHLSRNHEYSLRNRKESHASCSCGPTAVSRTHDSIRVSPDAPEYSDCGEKLDAFIYDIVDRRGWHPWNHSSDDLTEIEQRTGRRISELFDLIAGTSTGGILALGLTVPHQQERNKSRYEASQMVSFYEAHGKEIFQSFWRDVVSLHGLMEERYPAEPIEGVLQKYLGEETKLSQALTELVITSYEIETCRPFLFTRRRARAVRGGRFDPRMWEVGRSTTAAPTYFAPFQIMRSKSSHLPPLAFIDAGVFLNNPGSRAYAEAVSMHSRSAAAAARAASRGFEAERAPRGGTIR